MDVVEIVIPRPRVNEGSAFSATAYFRTRATSAAGVPTNAYYRIDDLTTGAVLQAWTALVAAASIAIPITAAHNAIQSQCNGRERRQLTVAGDYGLATQVSQTAVWYVDNLRGSP